MNPQALTGVAFLGFFLTGLVNSAFAPVFPFLIDDFHLPLLVAGMVFPVRSIGGFAGTLVGGIWSDTVGRKRLVLLGALLQALGLALVAITQVWSLALACFLLLGVGGGFQTAGLNALVVEVNPARRGLALNMLHAIYGLGSLIGPLAGALILTTEGNWRPIFLGSGLLWALFMVVCIIPTYPVPSGRSKGIGLNGKHLLYSPIFLLLLTVPFLYNGTATGLVGWITTYAQNEIQLPVFLGASLVSLFYVGLTLGRFICGAIADRVGHGRTLFGLSVGAALSYPLVVVSHDPIVLGLGVFLSGCFFSGLYPTAMAWATQLYPTGAGTVTGIMSTGMSLGVMVVPPLMGWVADYQGLGFSMTANYLGILLLVLVAGGLLRLRQTVAQGQSSGN